MAAFKIPDFNERAAAAREAKQRALDKLRAKPAPDPAIVAAKRAAAEAREAAAAERRAAKLAAAEQEKAAKASAKAAEQPTADVTAVAEPAPDQARPAPALPTQAELKAMRDARYAARKARQR